MKIWGMVVATVVMLTACNVPLATDLYGKGPVPNRAFVEQTFTEYKKTIAPGYLFVSENGNSVGYSYCPGQSCGGNEMRLAQDGCLQNSRGARCWIYARDQRVVWDETAQQPAPAIKP